MNNIEEQLPPQTTLTRRKFVAAGMIGFSAPLLPGMFWCNTRQINAVLFDAFVIFNPQPVVLLTVKLFPGKAGELLAIWRDKQFEYCWLRTTGDKYKDFYHVTSDALTYALKKSGVSVSKDQHEELIKTYLNLDIWPDVLPALKQLRRRGIRLAFLSNFTVTMMNSSLKRNNIAEYFEVTISTDTVKAFKPHPKAYQLGINTLKLLKEDVLFAAFAGWDAAGAKWFGYPTYWVNRAGQPAEQLDITPDGQGRTLTDLLAFLDSK